MDCGLLCKSVHDVKMLSNVHDNDATRWISWINIKIICPAMICDIRCSMFNPIKKKYEEIFMLQHRHKFNAKIMLIKYEHKIAAEWRKKI